jgi:hypothetical protein
MKTLLSLVFVLLLVGCQKARKEIEITMNPTDVADRIRDYYKIKYPSFFEFVVLSNKKDMPSDHNKKVDDLRKICPVEERVNSFHDRPFCEFIERTEKSAAKITRTIVELYSQQNDRCKIVISVDTENKRDDVGFSTQDPITEKDILNILQIQEQRE